MAYKMFLDDERMPTTDDYVVVRSFDEAVSYMNENGLPSFITFDHDLGSDFRNGFHVANWIVGYCLDNNISHLPNWEVHSQNPVGAENIRGLLNNAKDWI